MEYTRSRKMWVTRSWMFVFPVQLLNQLTDIYKIWGHRNVIRFNLLQYAINNTADAHTYGVGLTLCTT